eukprot:NODE_8687_length_372_cov_1.176656.p3 GENE.NODE_8687_length_372_cov_1.176656~~NODE_8687_length_372_cov_1.176656.p3  ORF type:complete len:65 (-),score=2.12 NODE_8687_length_372_cov_1.176656:56-250(-)
MPARCQAKLALQVLKAKSPRGAASPAVVNLRIPGRVRSPAASTAAASWLVQYASSRSGRAAQLM